MLVRFSSVATESVTMFGDVAAQLIKMLGASGALPGAIGADDIPAALTQLRRQLQARAAEGSHDFTAAQDRNENADDIEREAPIELATRAGPVIDILERAAAARAPVMWEQV